MTDHSITCPDDLPAPFDFDAGARAADLANDASLTSAYQHRPISRAELEAAIARLPVPQLSRRQA